MKFSATRRGVLALLGAAPAAPLAAKAIVDEQLAKMTGVQFGAGGGRIPYSDSADAGPPTASVNAEKLALEFFELFGVPEHVDDEYRRESLSITYLDPDIAAKKSWSHSVKIATQRQRNYEKLKDGMRHRLAKNRKTKAFRELTGFDWPYWY